MKLCSVCDKEIQGSWCKNCHRIVKTYTLPDDIYLNKSHDPKHDDNCTYHNPQAAHNVQTHGAGPAAQTNMRTAAQTNTRTAAQANARTGTYAHTQTGTQTRRKNAKRNRILFVIIFLYIGIMLVGTVGPLMVSAFSKVKSAMKSAPWKETEAHCDRFHMDWEVSDFEEWLSDLPGVVFEKAEDPFEPYEDSTDSEEYFGAYHEYHGSGNFWVDVDYDTKTEELHNILVICDFEEKHMDLCYEFLKKLDPKTAWSEEKFLEEVGKNKILGEYVEIYASDTVTIGVQEGESDLFIEFFPPYK